MAIFGKQSPFFENFPIFLAKLMRLRGGHEKEGLNLREYFQKFYLKFFLSNLLSQGPKKIIL